MKTKLILMFVVAVLFLTFSCDRKKAPTGQEFQGEGYLHITTSQKIYNWTNGESNKFVFIAGTLINQSESMWHSRLGAPSRPQEHENELFIAGNSDGAIEKYNAGQKSWQEIELLSLAIEGTQIKEIIPSQPYMLEAHLSIPQNRNESGKYRIRIDYLNPQAPDGQYVLNHDYSNEFVIR